MYSLNIKGSKMDVLYQTMPSQDVQILTTI